MDITEQWQANCDGCSYQFYDLHSVKV